MTRLFLFLFAGLSALTLLAMPAPVRAADDFLDAERAFVLSVKPDGDKALQLQFVVAPGYYLYGDKFKFTAVDASLGDAILPKGKVKFDTTFQKNVETHRDTVVIRLPVSDAKGEFKLTVSSQGCADKGLRSEERRVGKECSS